ncbi:MAG: alpha-E domain-containing protein [Lysinibacillus sp.]
MLSRVADSLYWLGRYAERTETNTQILSTQLDAMLEYSRLDGKYQNTLEQVVRICGYYEEFKKSYPIISEEIVTQYVMNDVSNYNAIYTLISNIRENARNARDIIPNELWEVWNELYLQLPELEQKTTFLDTTNHLNLIRRTCLTGTGIIDSLMTRDEGYLFLKIGKWLERTEKTALTLYHLMQYNDETFEKEYAANVALKMTNAFEDFTKRTRNRSRTNIINFLIGDQKCTRSVAYGLNKIKATVYDIENGKQQLYATQLFLALEELEQLVQIDAASLSFDDRVQLVNSIRNKLTLLGPIFSKTYYLTPPILVEEEVLAKQTL